MKFRSAVLAAALALVAVPCAVAAQQMPPADVERLSDLDGRAGLVSDQDAVAPKYWTDRDLAPCASMLQDSSLAFTEELHRLRRLAELADGMQSDFDAVQAKGLLAEEAEQGELDMRFKMVAGMALGCKANAELKARYEETIAFMQEAVPAVDDIAARAKASALAAILTDHGAARRPVPHRASRPR